MQKQPFSSDEQFAEFEMLELRPLLDLPVTKHLSDKLIKVSTVKEEGAAAIVAGVLTLAAFGVAGYGLWIYVLPQVFSLLGQLIGIVAGLAFVVLCMALWKPFKKWTELLSAKAYKAAIESNPMAELHLQLATMRGEKARFKKAKAQMKAIESKAFHKMKHHEKEAEEFQVQVQTTAEKANKIQSQMKDLEIAKQNQSDKFYSLQRELAKLLPKAERLRLRYNQSSDYIRRYGSRFHVVKQVNHKLGLAEIHMDNTIEDFQLSIEMMQDELDFAADAKTASGVVKSALGFKNKMEIDIALNAVSAATNLYLAEAAENFSDIDKLTSGDFSLDNDAMFARLENLNAKISSGEISIPNTKKYGRPDTILDSEDKRAGGALTDLFDD